MSSGRTWKALVITGGRVKAQDFDDLVKSIKQAGLIRRGESRPSREFRFLPEDAQTIREELKRLKANSRK